MDPMEAIRATFFQECDELLGDLETGLLAMQNGAGDSETVNSVFRAVHSIKGGAGAFGLDDLVRFAHVFETTLDGVRSGTMAATPEVIAILLRAADVLADHVTAAKTGQPLPAGFSLDVAGELERLSGVAPAAEADEDPFEIDFQPVAFAGVPASDPSAGLTRWRVSFTPTAAMYAKANCALRLLRELETLGSIVVEVDSSSLPPLADLEPEDAHLTWNVILSAEAAVDEERIREVFEFVDGDCALTIECDAPPAPVSSDAADGPETPEALIARLMAEASLAGPTAPAVEAEPVETGTAFVAPPATPAAVAPPSLAATAAPVGTPPSEPLVQTTIRVDLERVDRLIDLVGELVINQAMLAQQVVEAGLARSSTIALGLDDLEQLTREIQDSVMAIRAQPVKSVFQRMPRLVREVAAATGKRVRLVTEGEGTEVDKTVIERLSDPITHMIRNAIDHGLERPEERIAAGKPEEGVVRLSAQHRSGRIVIEVSDDGRGINRERVRAIAASRGVIDPDAVLSDEEVDNLIFAPGFSTADAVSDISGRGVGMDVVKRSIQALGGRIVINSRPGQGSTFTLSLPLTLAVLDGMVVTVGEQTLVVPISVIIETLQPKAADVRPLGPNGSVVAVRGSQVPLVDVASALNSSSSPEHAMGGVTLLVESELGGLAALRVDAIQGQRQVVIKSLEQNYRQVEGVAAATILGDGRVALILDVDGLIAARRRAAGPRPALPLAQAS